MPYVLPALTEYFLTLEQIPNFFLDFRQQFAVCESSKREFGVVNTWAAHIQQCLTVKSL
jgi:hypothetical protein